MFFLATISYKNNRENIENNNYRIRNQLLFNTIDQT